LHYSQHKHIRQGIQKLYQRDSLAFHELHSNASLNPQKVSGSTWNFWRKLNVISKTTVTFLFISSFKNGRILCLHFNAQTKNLLLNSITPNVIVDWECREQVYCGEWVWVDCCIKGKIFHIRNYWS
jgi:hypothetical protein